MKDYNPMDLNVVKERNTEGRQQIIDALNESPKYDFVSEKEGSFNETLVSSSLVYRDEEGYDNRITLISNPLIGNCSVLYYSEEAEGTEETTAYHFALMIESGFII